MGCQMSFWMSSNCSSITLECFYTLASCQHRFLPRRQNLKLTSKFFPLLYFASILYVLFCSAMASEGCGLVGS